MKTLHKIKKVIRNTLLSFICTCFFVVSSTSFAKADVIKQGTTATSYGSYHWECFAGTTDSPISLGLNIVGVNLSFRSGSGFSLRYNFKDKYSGQITIGITTSNSWRYIDAYCTVNGGAFNSTPASSSSYLTYHTFTINFEQCEYLEFTVYLDGVGYANYFNADTTISIAYGRTPVVDDKITEIDTLLDGKLPGMATNIANIYNQLLMVNQTLGQPDTYQSMTEAVEIIANFIGSDLDDYLSMIQSGLIDSNNVPYLDTVNDTLSSINTFISNIDSNTDGIESSLASILTAIQNIQSHDYTSTLSTINSRLNTLNSYISNIYSNLTTQFHTNLDIPYWQIPALYWSYSVSYTSGPYSSLSYNNKTGAIFSTVNPSLSNQTYDSGKGFTIKLNEPYIIVWGSIVSMNHGGGNLFGSPVYGGTPSSGTMSDYITYTDGTNISSGSGYYLNYVMFNLHDKYPSQYGGLQSTANVEFEFNQQFNIQAFYVGPVHNMPDEIAAMCRFEYDNTYTQLLQQIANGIGNISVQQIIENNTNIENYNNYQQQINNVENNYYQEFNNYETNIENNNTFNFTGLSNDGVSVYNNLFTNLYSIPLVKWPVLITLLGLVIVIILG